MNVLVKRCEERAMEITEYMSTNDAENLYINLQISGRICGLLIQSDGGLDPEIQHRINSG